MVESTSSTTNSSRTLRVSVLLAWAAVTCTSLTGLCAATNPFPASFLNSIVSMKLRPVTLSNECLLEWKVSRGLDSSCSALWASSYLPDAVQVDFETGAFCVLLAVPRCCFYWLLSWPGCVQMWEASLP